MPLVTDCSVCGQRFAAKAAGPVACPHCGRRVLILQPEAAKVPASDYWLVVKAAGWVLFAAVMLLVVLAGFIH